MAIHRKLKILICTTCSTAWEPAKLQSHVEDHGLRIPDFTAQLAKDVADHGIIPHSNIAPPPPNQAPVEGLAVSPGFYCTVPGCQQAYASKSRDVTRQHVSKHAAEIGSTSRSDYVKECHIQTLFNPQPIRYFRVNTDLTDVPNASAYHSYLVDIAPTLNREEDNPVPIRSNNDRPPLLRVTQWDIYLDKYLTSRDLRHDILEDASLPRANEPFLKGLKVLMVEYYSQGAVLASPTHHLVRRMLQQYPLYVFIVTTC